MTTQTHTRRPARRPRATAPGLVTLGLDVGGTGLKAGLLSPSGELLGERQKVATTYPMHPDDLVGQLCELGSACGEYDRVSIGFPGVTRGGRVITAPHFVCPKGPGTKPSAALTKEWRGFPLADEVARRTQKPTRLGNDAEVQGLAVIQGSGLELVVTLGTGVGTALFEDGRSTPHLELAHHPLRGKATYNDYLGEAARKAIGTKRWRGRVAYLQEVLSALINYDHLYLGGGNGARVKKVSENTTIVSNDAGVRGGVRLWDAPSGG